MNVHPDRGLPSESLLVISKAPVLAFTTTTSTLSPDPKLISPFELTTLFGVWDVIDKSLHSFFGISSILYLPEANPWNTAIPFLVCSGGTDGCPSRPTKLKTQSDNAFPFESSFLIVNVFGLFLYTTGSVFPGFISTDVVPSFGEVLTQPLLASSVIVYLPGRRSKNDTIPLSSVKPDCPVSSIVNFHPDARSFLPSATILCISIAPGCLTFISIICVSFINVSFLIVEYAEISTRSVLSGSF